MKFTKITVQVPTFVEMPLKACCVVPYKAFVPVMEGEITSNAHGLVRTYQARYDSTIWRLVFPGTDWGSFSTEMLNPDHAVAISFYVGANCKKFMGYPSGTEFFVINDAIYRRITWNEIGYPRKQSGLVAKVNRKDEKSFTYFMALCDKPNEEPLKSVIFSGLKEVFA